MASGSETSLSKHSSGQPGDILMTTRFTGNRKILFISVKYPGESGGIVTTSQLQNHANIVKTNLERNAYDSLSVTIDVIPQTLTMPNPVSYYAAGHYFTRMRADAAKIAEQAGYDVDSYDREVIFSRKIWGGAAAFGTLNKRTTFMSHNFDYITIHELGHSFGWRHTNFWQVSGGAPISANGTEIEYGDVYDMMGNLGPFAGPYHHFNPWLKYRVGWLPPESILEVAKSGSYTIQALDSDPQTGGSVTKYTALRIRRDPFTEYWLFFRSLEELINYGAVITRIFNTNIYPTHLLDTTPGSQEDDWRDAALAVGETFSDTQAGISVKVLSRTASEVQVQVTVNENAIASMDNLPLIDVVNPPSGQTIQGKVDYVVTTFDSDFGNHDGAGIDKVILYLHYATDALIVNLRQGLDPPTPVATKDFSAPPYVWQVDTQSSSSIGDRAYMLVARATSLDGGTRTVWFEHIIDNSALPEVPVLSSPADNAANVATSLTLVWNPSGGATSYEVQVSTQSNFSTTVVDESGLSATSLQVSGLAHETTYFWRVNATNTAGTSDWSTTRQFTTIVAAPATPVLSSPSDNATDVPTNPTLMWSAADRATSYQLQISTQSNFSTTLVDQSGITATSFQVTGLANQTIYYWRVRAANAGGTSDWSSVRRFTTIVAAPAAPVLSSPADNTSGVSINPTLTWNASSGATSYQVQVSAQSDFSTLEEDQSGITATSLEITGLFTNTTYYWRVNATNGGGTSPWSTVWQFTTEQATSVEEIADEIPNEFRLGQNYPNPFNSTTDIAFDLPKHEYVTLKVYTLLGTEIKTLVSDNLAAGKYKVKFDASGFATGVFFYKLQTGSFVKVRKMLFVR